MSEQEDFSELEDKLLSLNPAPSSKEFQNQLISIADDRTEVTRSDAKPQKNRSIVFRIASIAAVVLIGFGVFLINRSNSKLDSGVVINADKDLPKIPEFSNSNPSILAFHLAHKKGESLSEVLQAQSTTLLPEFPLNPHDLLSD